MAIEVKELHIRASVNENADSSSSGVNSLGLNSPNNDDLIQQCVDKVLEILKEKRER